MLANGNNTMSFNSFSEVPQFPYKMIEVLLTETDQKVEDFWKLLKYTDVDCLEKNNLSYEEKLDMVWTGDTIEQKYNIFVKPLVGSSLDTSEAQTQLRLYRYNTMPTNQYQAIICFEADFYTNEKTCLVRKDGILCEKTDLMESLFIDIMNGRDISIGSGLFSFNRELSRSCNSQLNIGNSKSFYGRSLVMGLTFASVESGGACG